MSSFVHVHIGFLLQSSVARFTMTTTYLSSILSSSSQTTDCCDERSSRPTCSCLCVAVFHTFTVGGSRVQVGNMVLLTT
jgi:hypothetical protein